MYGNDDRDFPYHAVRNGHFATRYYFPVKCSRCQYEKEYEAPKAFPDQVVAKRFKAWGWLLGRRRADDLCPRCVGVTPVNKLAERFKVTQESVKVPAPSEVAHAAERARELIDKVTQERADRIKERLELADEVRAMRSSLEALVGLMEARLPLPPKKKGATKAPPKKKKTAKAAVPAN